VYALLLLLVPVASFAAGVSVDIPPTAFDCRYGVCDLHADTTIGGVAPFSGETAFVACERNQRDVTGLLATDDLKTVFRAPAAMTISEVYCETTNDTVTLYVQIDDGTPADVVGTDLVCDTDGELDNTGLSGVMAAGDRLDWVVSAVSGIPLGVSVCVTYVYN